MSLLYVVSKNEQVAKCQEISQSCYSEQEEYGVIGASVIMMPLKPTPSPNQTIKENLYNLPMVKCETVVEEKSFYISLFEYENIYYYFIFSAKKVTTSFSLVTDISVRGYIQFI